MLLPNHKKRTIIKENERKKKGKKNELYFVFACLFFRSSVYFKHRSVCERVFAPTHACVRAIGLRMSQSGCANARAYVSAGNIESGMRRIRSAMKGGGKT